MPYHLLLRLIELLLRTRKRRVEDALLGDDGRPIRPWHSESDRTARTDRPYPGT